MARTARDFAAKAVGRKAWSAPPGATCPERRSEPQAVSKSAAKLLRAQAIRRARASAQRPTAAAELPIATGTTATVTATSLASPRTTATAFPARTAPALTELLKPSSVEEAAPRRRAWWGLLVLAALAVLVVGLMWVLLGRSRAGRGGEGLAGGAASTSASQPAVGTATAPARTSRGTSPATRSASTSGPPKQASTANHCASAAGCVVAGDDGGVVAALNAYRTSHGRAAVPGATTGQAQQCALSQGTGSTCAPHYAWQPVPTLDGTRVINMIAGRGDGAAWLLDSEMTSFSVGWAYLPGGAGGPGQYECAILKVG